MRVLVLASAGKDSSYAVWWAMLRGWEVAGLVTVRVTGDDSFMFQLPSTALAALQAKAAGLPWLPVPLSGAEATEMGDLEAALEPIVAGSRLQRHPGWSQAEREEAMWPADWPWPEDLARLRADAPIDGLVVGALRSDYQKTRVERMCQRLGIRSFTPLWHHPGQEHMQDLVDHGFELMLTSVSTDGLDGDWAGRTIDGEALVELAALAEKHRFHVDGEGGEYETAVLAAPWMNGRIELDFEAHVGASRSRIEIRSAKLIQS